MVGKGRLKPPEVAAADARRQAAEAPHADAPHASAAQRAATQDVAAPAAAGGAPVLVDAPAALAILRVKPQTLYAYASRSLVRVVPHGSSARGSLYYKDDIDAIASRSRKKRDGAAPGERHLRRGGAAILQTAISYISDQGPVYRGHGALQLAQSGLAFEQCVALLWSGEIPPTVPVWPSAGVSGFMAAHRRTLRRMGGLASGRQRQNLAIAAYTAALGALPEAAAGGALPASRQLVQVMAASMWLLGDGPVRSAALQADEPIAAMVAKSSRGGSSSRAQARRAIDAALIVCAEHELAPATFVARIAASAGADVFSCVSSALGAFEGQSNGAGCDACEAMLATAVSPVAYVRRLRELARCRRVIAGYSHAAYPAGDPRALYLIALARPLAAPASKAAQVLACLDAAVQQLRLAPSVIIGLVVLCHALELPAAAAGALMSLGRTAGWIAHCLEQRQSGFTLRPRAQYIEKPAPAD